VADFRSKLIATAFIFNHFTVLSTREERMQLDRGAEAGVLSLSQ